MKLGIITDIHEDVMSLQKALNCFEKNACDEIICLGDIVGFCTPYYKYEDTRNANECIRLVKTNCRYVVAGNHDLFAVKKLPQHRGGYKYPENWYDLSLEKKMNISSGKVWLYYDELPIELNTENQEFLLSLPEYIMTEIENTKYLFSHFIYPDITGSVLLYPWNKKDLTRHFEFLKSNDCMVSVCGHIHPQGLVSSYEPRKNFWAFLQYPFKKYPFGLLGLEKKLQCLSVPAIVNSPRKNGCTILETKNFDIVTMELDD